MPDSTPAPKPQSAKATEPAQTMTQRPAARPSKTKPQIISRQVFSDFANI
ncbi:hypothetical protein ACEWPL_003770 [Roseovarius sp. S1116L3]